MDGVEGAFCPLRNSSERRYHDRGSVFVSVPGVTLEDAPEGAVIGYYLAHSKALLKVSCAHCGAPQLRMGCKVTFAKANLYSITCKKCMAITAKTRLHRRRQGLGLVPLEAPQADPQASQTESADPE